MRFRIFLSMCAFISMAIPVSASERHSLDQNAAIFVMPGDSYINLFGSDWLRVFEVNRGLLFYDREGRLTSTPDKLVVGTKLFVPAGTYLTERALKRIHKYNDFKISALEKIREAESFRNSAPKHHSEISKQGDELLCKAKRLISGLDPDLPGYVEARRLAEESLKCFKLDARVAAINADITKKDNYIRELQTQITRERIRAYRWTETLYQEGILFVGLFMITAVTFLLIWRHRKKKDHLVRVKAWMEQHERRLNGLAKSRI